jgi:hypothetical protein
VHSVGNGSGLEQAEDFPEVFQGHNEPAARLFAYLTGKIFQVRDQKGICLGLSGCYPDAMAPAGGK